ncbi:Gti1/Pac2 family-domain-containing protein [Chytriomyces sp. MP71]|nr:Gti1/Pac2 family-domain-containing protein [Chytriomyces sp. MP71]
MNAKRETETMSIKRKGGQQRQPEMQFPATPDSPHFHRVPSPETKLPIACIHPQGISKSETFFGFVKDRHDAELLVEAVIAGLLHAVRDLSVLSSISDTDVIRSGCVIVFGETSGKTRWRDSFNWTPSRIQGPFLLYREIEELGVPMRKHENNNKVEFSSQFATKTIKHGTAVIKNGLCKRTVSITGSNSKRYRVISYFHPNDVAGHFERSGRRSSCHLKTPTQVPLFDSFTKERSRNSKCYDVHNSDMVMRTDTFVSETKGSMSKNSISFLLL